MNLSSAPAAESGAINGYHRYCLETLKHPSNIAGRNTSLRREGKIGVFRPVMNSSFFYSKSKTWSCGPPARRSCASESQVRDDRLCHRSNLFMVSGVSPAAGQKNGRSNRKRNFGNVGRATVPAGIWSAQWPTLRNSDEVSYKVSGVSN